MAKLMTIVKKEKKYLSQIKLLQDLTGKELDEFCSILKPVGVPKDTLIMKEGEVGDSMFLFADGEVVVTKNLTLKLGKRGFSNAEKSMVKLNSKTVPFFGEMAIFENDMRSATITASTDCLLYEIKRDDFDNICKKNKTLGYKIIRKIAVTLCKHLRKGNQDILKLTTALSIALSK